MSEQPSAPVLTPALTPAPVPAASPRARWWTILLGLLLLAAFERRNDGRMVGTLAVFGSAPMFFYLLHLYVLKLLYIAALAIWGSNQGHYFGFAAVHWIWLMTLALALLLFAPTRWFARLKARRRDMRWLKYL